MTTAVQGVVHLLSIVDSKPREGERRPRPLRLVDVNGLIEVQVSRYGDGRWFIAWTQKGGSSYYLPGVGGDRVAKLLCSEDVSCLSRQENDHGRVMLRTTKKVRDEVMSFIVTG